MSFASASILSKQNRLRWFLAVGTILVLAFAQPGSEHPGAEAMYKQDSVLYRIHTTRASLENIIRKYGAGFEDGSGYLKELDEIQSGYLASSNGDQQEGINDEIRWLKSVENWS